MGDKANGLLQAALAIRKILQACTSYVVAGGHGPTNSEEAAQFTCLASDDGLTTPLRLRSAWKEPGV